VTKSGAANGPASNASTLPPETPNCSRSLTVVKLVAIRAGNTTGIRLIITIDVVKKNTVQETGLGLIFSDFESGGFSGSFDCFSCLFLNFLSKLR